VVTGTPALSRRLSNQPFGHALQLLPPSPPKQQEVAGETMNHNTMHRAVRVACVDIFNKGDKNELKGDFFIFSSIIVSSAIFIEST
jgi:hypothetical protein